MRQVFCPSLCPGGRLPTCPDSLFAGDGRYSIHWLGKLTMFWRYNIYVCMGIILCVYIYIYIYMLSNESASKQVVCRVLSVLLPTDVAFMGGAALLAPYESQIPLVYRLAGQVFDFFCYGICPPPILNHFVHKPLVLLQHLSIAYGCLWNLKWRVLSKYWKMMSQIEL